MGRGPQRWTEELIARRLYVEKLGTGELSEYRPWLTVQEVSSRGRERRAWGHKTGRIHHLLSDVEWHLFLLLEWTADIVDIREQFPLERERTLRIAQSADIRHPRYPRTDVPTVMTADFVVTRVDASGQRFLEAYNTKCESEMGNSNSTAKLEIQRRYFEELNIAHHVVLDTQLRASEQANRIRNIAWIRETLPVPKEQLPSPDFFDNHVRRFVRTLSHGQNAPLWQFCREYDALLGFESGMSLRLAGVAMYQRLLIADLTAPDIAALGIQSMKARQEEIAAAGRKVA